jgi:hypothetical protein
MMAVPPAKIAADLNLLDFLLDKKPVWSETYVTTDPANGVPMIEVYTHDGKGGNLILAFPLPKLKRMLEIQKVNEEAGEL